jgi:hypothetical protein
MSPDDLDVLVADTANSIAQLSSLVPEAVVAAVPADTLSALVQAAQPVVSAEAPVKD